jgi:membrane associated rhomboid family serine protease
VTAREPEADWRCYRHPDREGGVRCRRCERPICPDCMITAPVGFQCPECVRGAPPVRTLRSLQQVAHATRVLIALNVVAFLPTMTAGSGLAGRGRSDLVREGALLGRAVADGEWWRLVTSGFLHFGLLHLGFNMLLLYMLGSALEPALGRVRFLALYLTALLGGSFGALLVQPDALTAGASGAVFGLMGATVAGMRRRGVAFMDSGIGGLLLINLVLTFVVPGISIGGHVGGLVAGTAAGGLLFATERPPPARAAGLLGCVALAGAAVVGAMIAV